MWILIYNAGLVYGIPLPTEPQLVWQEREIGVIIHFNMATADGTEGCTPDVVPDINKFHPDKLNTDQWLQSASDLGAKYAVYVAKHNCGYLSSPICIHFDE